MATPTFPHFEPTVGRVVMHAAQRHADAEFLVTPEGRLTYGDLERLSRNLAERLVADGVGKGTNVALLCPNGPIWVICWAAIARIGAVFVPASTFYKGPELTRFLRHADVRFLIGVPSFRGNDYASSLEANVPDLASFESVPLYVAGLPQLRKVLFWDESPVAWAAGNYGRKLDDSPPSDLADVVAAMENDVTPADRMMLMYTSGSTAEPKGVVHSHGAVTRHAVNMAAWSGWHESFRVWTAMPLFWIGAFHSVMFRCLVTGATVLTQAGFDPGEALAFMSAERATHVMAWPATTKALMEHRDFGRTDLTSILGGTMYHARPLTRRPPDPGLVCNSMGMTETCGPYCAPSADDDRNGVPEAYRGTYGRPVPGVEVRVTDLETGEFLTDGEEGEILVRGYSLMMGIHKKEASDVLDAQGWFHTGDRGVFRDGWLFFTGRESDMIKTGGSNVASGEVEAALGQCPGVDFAFVLGIPDSTRGEEVVALVVPHVDGDTTPITPDDLIRQLKSRLSTFKVPRRIHFIATADVEWLPSQKVNRRALRTLALTLEDQRSRRSS